MIQSISCPQCRQALRIGDGLLDKPIRCPKCQHAFTPRAAAPSPRPAAPATPARICPACKAKLLPRARSCIECGFLVPDESASPAAATAPPAPAAAVVAAPSPPAASPLPASVRAAAPAPAPVPAAPLSAAVAVAPLPSTPTPAVAASPPYWQLLPAGLLVLLLAGMVGRDLIFSPARSGDEGETFVDAPIDPTPRLNLAFADNTMQFGLSMARDKDDQGRPKRLTFNEKGASNFPCLAIDGKPYLFGSFFIVNGPVVKRNGEMISDPSKRTDEGVPGRWETKKESLGKAADGRERIGARSVWLYDRYNLWMTQSVEIVPSPAASPTEGKRLLDNALVRYVVENKDFRPHKVGLRFELDTFIGGNDGVPFTIPGRSSLCDTQCDFSRKEDVPDFVQALEHPSLEKPGTIAHLTLKVGGGLEAPSRVTLGGRSDAGAQKVDDEWLAASWAVPVKPIGGDSVVVMYWGEQELKPGDKREMGFAYGLGSVSSGEGSGRLGLTVGGSLRPGDPFSVTALVKEPTLGETLTLQLGAGLEMVQGDNLTQPVPPVPPGAASRNSPVTWKVKATRPGRFSLKVQSSTGAAQRESVTIRKGSALFD